MKKRNLFGATPTTDRTLNGIPRTEPRTQEEGTKWLIDRRRSLICSIEVSPSPYGEDGK